MKRNRKRYLCGLAVVTAVLVIALDLALLLTKDKEYSQIENRSLQTHPVFRWTEVLSGRYEENYEDYVADQFPLRSGWIRLKTFTDRLMGKTESNGIFLGKDGYLIEDFTEPDAVNWQETLTALENFSANYGELNQYLLAVPTAVSVLADHLPASVVAGDENKFLDALADQLPADIVFVDVREGLRTAAEEEQVYYRTDHHWTTAGAYAAYQVLAQTAGLSGRNTEYDQLLISDSFSGTLTASSGFRMSETDPIYIYVPRTETVDYNVNYVEEGTASASYYCMENLEVRDQYTVFFDGNHPLVRIETNAKTDRVLLVIKDSYANCFVPFLTEDFDEILMVDARYYADDLELLINTEQVTDVLFLYNANTLASDGNLKTVL